MKSCCISAQCCSSKNNNATWSSTDLGQQWHTLKENNDIGHHLKYKQLYKQLCYMVHIKACPLWLTYASHTWKIISSCYRPASQLCTNFIILFWPLALATCASHTCDFYSDLCRERLLGRPMYVGLCFPSLCYIPFSWTASISIYLLFD